MVPYRFAVFSDDLNFLSKIRWHLHFVSASLSCECSARLGSRMFSHTMGNWLPFHSNARLPCNLAPLYNDMMIIICSRSLQPPLKFIKSYSFLTIIIAILFLRLAVNHALIGLKWLSLTSRQPSTSTTFLTVLIFLDFIQFSSTYDQFKVDIEEISGLSLRVLFTWILIKSLTIFWFEVF